MALISNPKAANRFGPGKVHNPRAAGYSSESAAYRREKIPATAAFSASAVKDYTKLCISGRALPALEVR
jgi:hypothetical protein